MHFVAPTFGTRWRRGFTLIEMTIVGALMVMVLGALCGAWQVGVRSWEVAEANAVLRQELRKGSMYMTEDLMECGASTIAGCPADNNWHSSISFRKATGVENGQPVWSDDTVTYGLGGLHNQQIMRTEGSAQRVVANKIVTFSVRRHPSTPTLLEITLRAREAASGPDHAPQSSELVTKIRLRN